MYHLNPNFKSVISIDYPRALQQLEKERESEGLVKSSVIYKRNIENMKPLDIKYLSDENVM